MTSAPRATASLLALLGLLAAGCKGDTPDFAPATDRPQTDDTGEVTDDSALPDDSGVDDTAPPDDSGADDSGASGNLDEEGDIYGFGADEDEVSLADASGDANLDQEFFLIASNSSNSSGGFRLRYGPASASGAAGPPAPRATGGAALSPLDARQRALLAAREPAQRDATPTPPPFTEADIGSARQTFNVSAEFEGDGTSPVRTRLWAIGDFVSIWVDEEVPIDWDFDCDGFIDRPAAYEAYGFNNCDLQTVADIVDNNLIANIRALFGEESDINGDGKVSVVITPVLNTLPLTSEDEDDWPQVASYADPVTDLNDYSEDSNPGSDEQEVIYVFAPDPYGFYNPFFPTTVDEYTSMGLAAEVARSYLKLVLYNAHVLSYEADPDQPVEDLVPTAGQPEETWLTEVLGAMAADYCGFGAVYHLDAWRYLDASYLFSLTAFNQDSLFSVSSRGAQYLFGRWLLDTYGTVLLTALAQTEYTGIDNVEQATGEDFDDLIRRWQVAMLVTDVTDTDGEALVDNPSDWPLYHAAETLSAPTTAPETPSAGIFYGANGHQRGFNVRGVNRWIEGGTTSNPVENASRRVVANGPDFHTYTPGFNFYGYAEGGYGVHFVRLTRLEYESAAVQIDSSVGDPEGEEPTGIVGAVIRWRDATFLDNVVDDIYSPLDANTTSLPALPTGGVEIYAFGEIGNPVTTQVVDASGTSSGAPVADTDRYLLDLTDRSSAQLVQVAVWLDRRFTNTSGQVSLEDPWLALLPVAAVPSPSVNSHNSSSCATSTTSWSYPNRVLDYVATQVFLSEVLLQEGDLDLLTEGVECPTSQDTYGCELDWDRDGIQDADEAQPSSFAGQVMVEACQSGDAALLTDLSSLGWIDADSLDEDDLPAYSNVYNVGGRSGDDGEEALLVDTLRGGAQYVIVVGGGGDVGPYELSIKQLN